MRNKTSARSLLARERENMALTMRQKDYSYAAIGVKLGVSEQAAWKMVKKIMDRTAARCDEKAEQIRRMEINRMELLRKAYWDKALGGVDDTGKVIEPDLQAAYFCKSIGERLAALQGLDKPKEITLNHTSDIDAKLNDLISKYRSSGSGGPDISREIPAGVAADSPTKSIDSGGRDVVQLASVGGSWVRENGPIIDANTDAPGVGNHG